MENRFNLTVDVNQTAGLLPGDIQQRVPENPVNVLSGQTQKDHSYGPLQLDLFMPMVRVTFLKNVPATRNGKRKEKFLAPNPPLIEKPIQEQRITR